MREALEVNVPNSATRCDANAGERDCRCGTAFDPFRLRHPTLEREMADRNQKDERTTSKTQKSPQSDQSDTSRDDGIEQNPDPDSEKSAASRPRGHTEAPDRTL
jgi:hypothetical protein